MYSLLHIAPNSSTEEVVNRIEMMKNEAQTTQKCGKSRQCRAAATRKLQQLELIAKQVKTVKERVRRHRSGRNMKERQVCHAKDTCRRKYKTKIKPNWYLRLPSLRQVDVDGVSGVVDGIVPSNVNNSVTGETVVVRRSRSSRSRDRRLGPFAALPGELFC